MCLCYIYVGDCCCRLWPNDIHLFTYDDRIRIYRAGQEKYLLQASADLRLTCYHCKCASILHFHARNGHKGTATSNVSASDQLPYLPSMPTGDPELYGSHFLFERTK